MKITFAFTELNYWIVESTKKQRTDLYSCKKFYNVCPQYHIQQKYISLTTVLSVDKFYNAN